MSNHHYYSSKRYVFSHICTKTDDGDWGVFERLGKKYPLGKPVATGNTSGEAISNAVEQGIKHYMVKVVE